MLATVYCLLTTAFNSSFRIHHSSFVLSFVDDPTAEDGHLRLGLQKLFRLDCQKVFRVDDEVGEHADGDLSLVLLLKRRVCALRRVVAYGVLNRDALF